MYRDLLADATFHELLLAYDRDLADTARCAGCARCSGVVHSAPYWRKPRGRPCYDDKDGAVAFVVDRFQFQTPDGSFVLTEDGKPQKTFSQRRPDPRGSDSWIWNVEGAPVVPYRLPALIETVANKRTLLIVEGEAKVDLLWSWDMPATCCAGGAKKWRIQNSEFLRDADVVIIPDNDDAGRGHVDVVAHRALCHLGLRRA